MKLITLLFYIIFAIAKADEFSLKSIGKLIRNETMNFPQGGKFVSFKHQGGFETNKGQYGNYYCSGNILYDKESTLEDMNFACEFKDKRKNRFITMGKRLKGSEVDRAVGKMNIIEAEGDWKNYIGYICTYAVEYVEDTIFSPAKCKK